MQAQTAKLFMWVKHRKHSFTGSKSCGRFTASLRSSFPSKPASPTNTIRPLRQGLKRNCEFPPLNVWRTHTALKSGNCCLPNCPKRRSKTPAPDLKIQNFERHGQCVTKFHFRVFLFQPVFSKLFRSKLQSKPPLNNGAKGHLAGLPVG